MGWQKGKKRGPQSRELVERRLAWRKDKVLVSKSDAALLEAVKQAELSIEEAIAFFKIRTAK